MAAEPVGKRNRKMDGWTVVTWSLAAAVGALLFLRIVALGIACGAERSRQLERHEKEARKRRIQQWEEDRIVAAELESRRGVA